MFSLFTNKGVQELLMPFNILTLRYFIDVNPKEFILLPYILAYETFEKQAPPLVLALTPDQHLELKCKTLLT